MSTATTIASVDAFQIDWTGRSAREGRSAFVRITTTEGIVGYGEATPMSGGDPHLHVITHDLAPMLVGADALDHAVLHDRMLHRHVKLGPEGVLAGALAAVDLALWDVKGRSLGLPVHRLLGGAWRTEVPFYASIGGNFSCSVDETLTRVERRLTTEAPAAIKIRLDGDRTVQDHDVPGDLAKIRAVRRLVGDDLPLAFDANNQYSFGTAIRVGRVLEDEGYAWFEEPVQHYDVRLMGAVAQKLDITVSAGEQSYTLAALADLISAGVRMLQPDLVKMGGITGLMRAAALCSAHGVEFVPHQTQPGIGHVANLHVLATVMHSSRPAEYADPSGRCDAAFHHPVRPRDGRFALPEGPGLGLEYDHAAIDRLRVPACT